MKLQIYSVYDNKAGTWMKPFYAQNNAVAQRTFSDATNDPNSLFNKHPTDFVLFQVGEWDDQKGTLIAAETQEKHGHGRQLQTTRHRLRAVQ